MKEALLCFEIIWYMLTSKYQILLLDLVGRVKKTAFLHGMEYTLCKASSEQVSHPSTFPTAFPYCCKWCHCLVRQKETDLSFFKAASFLLSSVLCLSPAVVQTPSRRKIKEQYGKIKETTRVFIFKDDFLKSLCSQILTVRF